MIAREIISELQKQKNDEQAKHLSRFFKTGKGQYGEGDVFWGIKVPVQRTIAKKHKTLDLEQVQKLLTSSIHEHRLTALLILTYKYEKADEKLQKEIYGLYLKNTKYINNWDLVDLSAPKIVGVYLLEREKERKILYKFAQSKDLWEKRIAMLACYTFIKNKQFDETLKISEILLHDKHDLIHKAVGWMLRELGKIDQAVEEKFLQKYYRVMPRTMLRYSIERFDEKKRKFYMGK